jgi:hypothetical protein
MRFKILFLTITLSVFTLAPADAFFNRDCSNLKKRVTTLQSQSDRAWDKYQESIGRTVTKGLYFPGDEPLNRALEVANIGLSISQDMRKYYKCIKPTSIAAQMITELTAIRKQMLVGSFKSDMPFKMKPNYLRYLK